MSRLIMGILFVLAITQPANAFFSFGNDEAVAVSQNERRCMAEAIYHEARGESRQGKIAVGNVVMNRINSGRYADTVCGVVYQRSHNPRVCQFSWTCRRNVRIVHQHLWEEALIIADEVMRGQHQDYSRGAIAFNNAPFRNMRQTIKIGNHYFYTNRRTVNNNS